MHNTKRKFNTLIQGIGSRASNQPTDTSASRSSDQDIMPSNIASATGSQPIPPSAAPLSSISADFLAKRRRANDIRTGKLTVHNVTYTTWASDGKKEKIKTTEPPRYCPGDRDQLIRRLATFQELTEWTPKPDKVGEIEWAKRGWVCQGKDRVRCTLCNKELVVKTNKRLVDGNEEPVLVGSDVEDAMVKRFAELIVGAHQSDCLWRKQGCDSSLLRLSLTSAQTALPALRKRYDELCARSAFLPYLFNLRLPPSFSLDTVKSQLPPKFFTEPPSANTAVLTTAQSDVALALAMMGWQGLNNPRIGQVPNSASCATCLRRLGLWMFKSKEVDQDTGEILVPAPMDHLDPVREHRLFCPWRNAAAQRNPGSKAAESDSKTAWEVLALTVRNAAYLRGEGTPQRTPGHAKSKSQVAPSTPTPNTSRHAPTLSESGFDTPGSTTGSGLIDYEEEDEKERDAQDKERWARLRKVKSLFSSKNRNRLSRTLSRPGTAKSTATEGSVQN
ncbi:C3HC zinc finger-like-domain-containing protein [Xylariales sp. PMI_506]|nr:C3HC zinc finger-like-domain-containing protein [Xylariales sp. PMI_506]